ncbi:MAG TPA: NHL repeat-containing protein [Bacteroidota bacterium]|nr:NHL repeat-containing protein [Bacteroidota bacterium]
MISSNRTLVYLAQLTVSMVATVLVLGAAPRPQTVNKNDDQSPLSFKKALAIAVDSRGIVYVLDGGANEVLSLGKQEEVVVRTGGYGWSQFAFDNPRDLIAPNGLDIYVADYGNHRIQRFDRNLNLVSSLPSTGGEAGPRIFGYPRSVAVASSGALYVTDGENNRILQIDADGSMRSFGGIDAARGRLRYPARVRVSSNEIVFVQDSNAIVAFDRFGNFMRRIGDHLFRELKTFTTDEDTIYALDGCRLFKLSERGSIEDTVDDFCSEVGPALLSPVDLAVRQGKCYLLTEHAVHSVAIDTLFRKKSNSLKYH